MSRYFMVLVCFGLFFFFDLIKNVFVLKKIKYNEQRTKGTSKGRRSRRLRILLRRVYRVAGRHEG